MPNPHILFYADLFIALNRFMVGQMRKHPFGKNREYTYPPFLEELLTYIKSVLQRRLEFDSLKRV